MSTKNKLLTQLQQLQLRKTELQQKKTEAPSKFTEQQQQELTEAIEQIVDLEELDHDIVEFRIKAPKDKALQQTLASISELDFSKYMD